MILGLPDFLEGLRRESEVPGTKAGTPMKRTRTGKSTRGAFGRTGKGRKRRSYRTPYAGVVSWRNGG